MWHWKFRIYPPRGDSALKSRVFQKRTICEGCDAPLKPSITLNRPFRESCIRAFSPAPLGLFAFRGGKQPTARFGQVLLVLARYPKIIDFSLLWSFAIASIGFLFCPVLEAASKSGFDAGCGIGYRRDHIFFSMARDNSLFYKESGRDLKAVALDLFFDIKVQNVLLCSYADSGWFVSGQTHDISMAGAPQLPNYRGSFHQSSGGFFADAKESLGYLFDFTNRRRSGFQILPETGYSLFYQNLKRGVSHPETVNILDIASLSCDLAHFRLQRQWWGPFVGGALIYGLMKAWTFEFGYFYYFLQLKQKFASFEDVTYLTPGSGISSQFFIWSKNRSFLSAQRGQSYRFKMKAQVDESWRVNLLLDLYRFSSKGKKAHVVQKIQELFPAQQVSTGKLSVLFKAKWVSFSLILEAEYFY
jgi:hypothetical protein